MDLKTPQEKSRERELMRVDVMYEDSPFVLSCSSWAHDDMTFTLNQQQTVIHMRIKSPKKRDMTTAECCYVSYAPGACCNAITTLIHAITAVVEIRHFPFRNECIRLIALLRSENTTHLLFAPVGTTLQNVCLIAAQSATDPIIPMLVCGMDVTEFLTPTWTLFVSQDCGMRNGSLRKIVIIVKQHNEPILIIRFRAADNTWYDPVNFDITYSEAPSFTVQNKALSYLLRNKHVRNYPFGCLLTQLSHQFVANSIETMYM